MNNKVCNDPVNHPSHYTAGKVECLDAIESACLGKNSIEAFLTGQVIKYLWRYNFKGKPLEDTKKAQFYLNRLIQYQEEQNSHDVK